MNKETDTGYIAAPDLAPKATDTWVEKAKANVKAKGAQKPKGGSRACGCGQTISGNKKRCLTCDTPVTIAIPTYVDFFSPKG